MGINVSRDIRTQTLISHMSSSFDENMSISFCTKILALLVFEALAVPLILPAGDRCKSDRCVTQRGTAAQPLPDGCFIALCRPMLEGSSQVNGVVPRQCHHQHARNLLLVTFISMCTHVGSMLYLIIA